MTRAIHPACAMWPEWPAADFALFVADLRARGLLEDITVMPDDEAGNEGPILDGKTRFRGCTEAGIPPRFTVYRGGDPIAFVISRNKHRRHMDQTALAFVAASLATLNHGGDRRSDNFKPSNGGLKDQTKSVAAIAAEMNIPVTSVERAKAILDKGTDEIVNLVKGDKKGLLKAAEYVRKTPKDQQKASDLAKPKANSNGSRRSRGPRKPPTPVNPQPLGANAPTGSTANNDAAPTTATAPNRPTLNRINDRINEGPEAAAAALLILDHGYTYEQAEAETGVGNTPLRSAVAREEGRRNPHVDRATLAKNAQQKIAAAINREEARLQAHYLAKHRQDMQDNIARLKREILPQWTADARGARINKEYYERLINNHRPLFSEAEFTDIIRCLHPDSRDTVSVERLRRAFQLLNDKKLQLTNAPQT